MSHALAALPPGKATWYPLNGGWVDPRISLDALESKGLFRRWWKFIPFLLLPSQ
jgi:hypothetical protein